MENRVRLLCSVLALCAPTLSCSSRTTWDAGDVQLPTDLGVDGFDASTVDAIDAPSGDAPDATDTRPDMGFDIQYADVTRDVATDVMIRPTGEYVYVMSALTVDPDNSAAVPHTGFDVDGLASTSTDPAGCNHTDFGSVIDPDQNSPSNCVFGTPGCNGAVDNQFPTMANTIMSATSMDARALLTQSIDHHQLVLLLRLTRVDSFVDDADVGVQVYRGFPTFSTGCTTVSPGRVYQVDQASLTTGGTTLEDAAFNVAARIIGGRLQFAAPVGYVFTLRGTGLIPISIYSMRMRGDVTPDGLRNGNLGGYDTGQDLVDQLTPLAGPAYQSLIPMLVGGFVDIQIMGICRTSGTPPRFGGVSLGAGFQAVPAIISATTPIATSQAFGTCGTF